MQRSKEIITGFFRWLRRPTIIVSFISGILIIIISLIFVVGSFPEAGFFYFARNKAMSIIKKNILSPLFPTIWTGPRVYTNITTDFKLWKRYEQWGYRMSYPPEWEVEEGELQGDYGRRINSPDGLASFILVNPSCSDFDSSEGFKVESPSPNTIIRYHTIFQKVCRKGMEALLMIEYPTSTEKLVIYQSLLERIADSVRFSEDTRWQVMGSDPPYGNFELHYPPDFEVWQQRVPSGIHFEVVPIKSRDSATSTEYEGYRLFSVEKPFEFRIFVDNVGPSKSLQTEYPELVRLAEPELITPGREVSPSYGVRLTEFRGQPALIVNTDILLPLLYGSLGEIEAPCEKFVAFVYGEYSYKITDPSCVGLPDDGLIDDSRRVAARIYDSFELLPLQSDIDNISQWKTYRSEEYGLEFKYPLMWSVGEINGTVVSKDIAVDYLSSEEVAKHGVSYCSANPNDSLRCESLSIEGVTNRFSRRMVVDWGNTCFPTAKIGHPNGGSVELDFRFRCSPYKESSNPNADEIKKVVKAIISTFNFLGQPVAE